MAASHSDHDVRHQAEVKPVDENDQHGVVQQVQAVAVRSQEGWNAAPLQLRSHTQKQATEQHDGDERRCLDFKWMKAGFERMSAERDRAADESCNCGAT